MLFTRWMVIGIDISSTVGSRYRYIRLIVIVHFIVNPWNIYHRPPSPKIQIHVHAWKTLLLAIIHKFQQCHNPSAYMYKVISHHHEKWLPCWYLKEFPRECVFVQPPEGNSSKIGGKICIRPTKYSNFLMIIPAFHTRVSFPRVEGDFRKAIN